jgi:hypothetical protein
VFITLAMDAVVLVVDGVVVFIVVVVALGGHSDALYCGRNGNQGPVPNPPGTPL